MLLRNNRHQRDQRRENQRRFNDAPMRVDVEKSIRDLRRIYGDMTDIQFSKWYQQRYRINAQKVLMVISRIEAN